MLIDRLIALGWGGEDPMLRVAIPSLAKGNNLVLVAPPAPAYAGPVLAGVLERRTQAPGDALIVAPQTSLPEWNGLVSALAADAAPAPVVALGSRQAERWAASAGGAGVMVASPAVALGLRRRSRLAVDRLTGVVAAWPELWEDREALTELLQDVARETQRVIITSAPEAASQLIERHAWRATTVGTEAAGEAIGPVRIASVPWHRRVLALGEITERLGSASLAVWTADRSHHEEIRRATAGLGVPCEVTAAGSVPRPAALVVAFDPPRSEILAGLCQAGAVVLLAPPGTEAWLARIAAPASPLVLSGAMDAVEAELARRRARIEQAIGSDSLELGFQGLAPLFEQHDPAAVAAALYGLWIGASRADPRPAAAEGPSGRIWVGAGRRDEIGVGDLVGLLANELRIDRGAIGRVDLRETFSLIEVPLVEAERIAQAMTGRTLRKRRLVARVDRKPKP